MKSAPPKAFWVPLCCLFAAMVVIAAGTRTPVEPADETLDRPGLALPVFTDITRRAGLNMKIICGDEVRSEEHTSELQSRPHLVCRLLLEKKKELSNAQWRDTQ